MGSTTAVKTYVTRAEADTAKTDGEVICATLLPDGTPVYFTVALDATEDEVRDLSFQIREDRKLNDSERVLIAIAELVQRRASD